jgi:hypothetical protein
MQNSFSKADICIKKCKRTRNRQDLFILTMGLHLNHYFGNQCSGIYQLESMHILTEEVLDLVSTHLWILFDSYIHQSMHNLTEEVLDLVSTHLWIMRHHSLWFLHLLKHAYLIEEGLAFVSMLCELWDIIILFHFLKDLCENSIVTL